MATRPPVKIGFSQAGNAENQPDDLNRISGHERSLFWPESRTPARSVRWSPRPRTGECASPRAPELQPPNEVPDNGQLRSSRRRLLSVEQQRRGGAVGQSRPRLRVSHRSLASSSERLRAYGDARRVHIGARRWRWRPASRYQAGETWWSFQQVVGRRQEPPLRSFRARCAQLSTLIPMVDLSDRECELLETMVRISEAGEPFEIPAGEDTLTDPRWPAEVPKPTRVEVRSLVGRQYVEVDRTVATKWRFWPADAARQEFAGEAARRRAEALRDPDVRLGVILDAIVEAFEQDPATPLLMLRTDQVDIVRHPHWPIEPDVVRMHDLRQLEDLKLIGWDGTTEFFPTPTGRMASKNQAGFLAQRADEVADEEERSRLRRMAEKFRAGDVAVSAAGGLTGAAIRAALGTTIGGRAARPT